MKIVIKKAGKPSPEVTDIDGKLESMQKIVNNGYLEVIPFGNHIDLMVNEEGKLKNLEPNFYFPPYNDTILGDVFFMDVKGKGLSNKQINIIMKFFNG